MKTISFSLLIFISSFSTQAETLHLNQYLWGSGHIRGYDLKAIQRDYRRGESDAIDQIVIRSDVDYREDSEGEVHEVVQKRVTWPTYRQARILRELLQEEKFEKLQLSIRSKSYPSRAILGYINALDPEKADVEVMIENCLSRKTELDALLGLTREVDLHVRCRSEKEAQDARQFLAQDDRASALGVRIEGPRKSTHSGQPGYAYDYPQGSDVQKFKKAGLQHLTIRSELINTGQIGGFDEALSSWVRYPSGNDVRYVNQMQDFATVDIEIIESAPPGSSKIKHLNAFGPHVNLSVRIYRNCPDSEVEKKKLQGTARSQLAREKVPGFQRPITFTLECQAGSKSYQDAVDNAAEIMNENPNVRVFIRSLWQ